MRTAWVFALVFLLACASDARAGGFNLTWSDYSHGSLGGCWPENPQNVKTFACNTNSGSSTLVVSFVPDADCPDFCQIGVVINGQSVGWELPDWWQLYNAGSCRQASLSASADFTLAPRVHCVDPWRYWANPPQGGIATYQTSQFPPPPPLRPPGPNRCVLKAAYALVEPESLFAQVQYYGMRVIVNHQKTVGSDACAGCEMLMGFCLEQVYVGGFSGSTQTLTRWLNNKAVGWNGSYMPTATANMTWGKLKSLYR